MSQRAWAGRCGRVFGIVFVALGVYGIFISEQRPPVAVGVLFLTAVALCLWSWIHDRSQERRLATMLAGRTSLDLQVFADTFRGLNKGPEAAVAIRNLLEEHIGVDLSGLRPEDPLDAMRDYLDPIFFDELGEELGFRSPENYPEFSAMVTPLKTVRDLVEVVARRCDEA